MNIFGLTLSEQFVRALGWTLIHSLWQGALVAFLLAIVMVYLRKHHSKLRYTACCLSLVFFCILPVLTFVLIYRHPVTAGSVLTAQPVNVHPITTGMIMLIKEGTKNFFSGTIQAVTLTTRQALDFINANLQVFILVWLTGVFFFMTRFLGGLYYVNRLKHHRVREADDGLRHLLNDLSHRMRIQRPVRMLESALVKVPMVAGILKPVILLPAGLVSGLPMAQIEMILIHELVHIQRRDYLVNIIQSVMEVFFFYHPAMWWISRHLRLEREHLCDDMTLAVTGDSITYARTLASLREMELHAPALASTMAQNKHQLLGRIRRITGLTSFKPVSSGGLLPVTVILITIMTFLLGMVISDKTDAGDIRATGYNRNDGAVPASKVFNGLLYDHEAALPHMINANDRFADRQDPDVCSGGKDIITDRPDTSSRKQADTSLIRDQKSVYNDMQTLSKALQQLGEELSSMQEDFRRLQKQIQEESTGAYDRSQGDFMEQQKKAMEQYKEAMGQYRKLMEEKQKELQERFRDDSLRKRLGRLYYNFSDSCKPGVYFYGMPGYEYFPLPDLGDQFRGPGSYYYYYKNDTTCTDSPGKEQYEKYLRFYSNFDSLKVDTSIAHAFKQWKWDWKPPKGAFIYPGDPDSINAALEEFYKQLPQLLDDEVLNDLLAEPPALYDFHFDAPPALPDESYPYVIPEPDDKGFLKGYRHIDNYYDFQKVKQIIREELLDDGLITPGRNYIIEINAREMVINGVKQSKSVYTKYRRLLESAIGEELKEGITYYF